MKLRPTFRLRLDVDLSWFKAVGLAGDACGWLLDRLFVFDRFYN